eukprot:gnl/MRDRNA2_/MRDRNA2_70309_c0_seq1.p1 gnl/MRDRNA2_/MRDRNA2_70309_c0~~gnl/MRDRNA2_/MRDRNA2_70309_c0_seq1.p1  ORF type:complete len:238 (-),score=26.29 gnl/MRDRNA2_/MRDRNA2_70309_c0_seq1:304-1017(-)
MSTTIGRLLIQWAFLLYRFSLAKHLDFLFIVFDAGESNQLKYAIDLLASLSSSTIAVLALGKPATSIFEGKPYLQTLVDFGIKTVPGDDKNRSQLLTKEELAAISSHLPEVGVVVPGMAYAMQAQIASLWPEATVQCIQDGFGLWNEDWGAAKYFVSNNVCTEILVPSTLQRDSLNIRDYKHIIQICLLLLLGWSPSRNGEQQLGTVDSCSLSATLCMKKDMVYYWPVAMGTAMSGH